MAYGRAPQDLWMDLSTSFAASFQGTTLVSFYSLIAQLVEHSTVNRVVTGSSPVRGAIWRGVRVVEGARLEIV